jgi:hypothetical protein
MLDFSAIMIKPAKRSRPEGKGGRFLCPKAPLPPLISFPSESSILKTGPSKNIKIQSESIS